MSERLLGKNAVITGASSGMGKAIALSYIKEGANVVAMARRKERLDSLVEEVNAMGLGDKLEIMAGDISIDADCVNAFEVCHNRFGICNVLVQNAGIMDNFARVGDIDDEVWEKVISVNLTGPMRILRAAIRYFVKHEVKANVVVVTSDAVAQQCTGGATYAASKCGTSALVGAAVFGYSHLGMRFNQICPGGVASNIHESMFGYKTFDQGGYLAASTRGYLAHKAEWVNKESGVPEDIAPLAVFLASDESEFVNNQRIMVNGGLNLG